MTVVEARRLTGPGWLLDGSGAALHVPVASQQAADAVAQTLASGWRAGIRTLASQVAPELLWPVDCRWQSSPTSLAFAVAAPWDVLDLAVDWLQALVDQHAFPADAATQLAQLARPQLRRWLADVSRLGHTVLLDDARLTVGLGSGVQTLDVQALPVLTPVDADPFPIALVTGTNGKTTTARLLTRMLRSSGLCVGSTSTDGWAVNEVMLEAGDWTGPGGARLVLRTPQVQAAVLETARGGLLRRGLAITGGPAVGAQVAVVTSVSSDHLGEWGVDTLSDLAAVKLSVAKGVRNGGWLVLHAGSPALVEAAQAARTVWQQRGLQVVWFASTLAEASAPQQPGDGLAWLADDQLSLQVPGSAQPVTLLPTAEVALGLGGMAEHNLLNALAASAAGVRLGLTTAQVVHALQTFGSQPHDNPGRAGCWNLHGALVVVDFAHNPEGMAKMVRLAQQLAATRRWLVFGQAGDRTLADLRGLVQAALPLQPDGWLIKDTVHYLRGRAPGELPTLLRALLMVEGVADAAIETFANEPDAVASALARLASGDLLLLLVHDDAAAAEAQLQAAGAVPWQGPLPRRAGVA